MRLFGTRSRLQIEAVLPTHRKSSGLNTALSYITTPHRLAAKSLATPNPMHTLINSTWWTFSITSIVQLVLFIRWLYRHIRNEELTRAFVHDMAANHLPHIYELLEMLCDEQGIKRNPLPPIRWIDLNYRPRT